MPQEHITFEKLIGNCARTFSQVAFRPYDPCHLPPASQPPFILQTDSRRCQMSDVSGSPCESGEHSAEVDQSQHSSASKKRRALTVLHVDMNETFWLQRPHLLNETK